MRERETGHLCIVAAVEIEFKIAAGLLTDAVFSTEERLKVCRGHFGRRRVTILKSEMGAAGFAARLAERIQKDCYDLLVVAGLAGALNPKLKIGDAVVFDLCHKACLRQSSTNSREKPSAREENASINCDHQISGFVFGSLRASGLSCFLGSGVTVDKILTRASDKLRFGMRYNAMAVDMETYDVLAVCALHGLPAAALRVVSDETGSDLPDFNRALDPDGRMSWWRVGAVMLTAPLISARFLLNMKTVTNALRAHLTAVLGARVDSAG